MELQFNRKPCLILEATELLYVFVNQLSPRMLTADGPYCIPPAEVSAIMEEVCGQLVSGGSYPALLLPEIPAAGAIRRHLVWPA